MVNHYAKSTLYALRNMGFFSQRTVTKAKEKRHFIKILPLNVKLASFDLYVWTMRLILVSGCSYVWDGGDAWALTHAT